MKSRYLILAGMQLILLTSLPAQETDGTGISYSVQAGLSLQNMMGRNSEGDKLGYSQISCFRIGFSMHMPVKQSFSMSGALFIAQKGAEKGIVSPRDIYKIFYLEVPLLVTYRTSAGKGVVELGAGPYAGYGIKGKTILKGNNEKLETDMVFRRVVEQEDTYSVNYFKRLDAGLGVLAGYQWPSGIILQVSGNLGILTINPEDKRIPDDQMAIRNVGLGMLVGVAF